MVEADRGDLQLWDTWPVRICAEQDTAGSTLGLGAGSAASRSANDEVGCWRGLAGALGQPGPFTVCPVQGGLLVGPSPWKLEGQEVDVSELCVTNKLRKIHNDVSKATQIVGGRSKVEARFPDFRLRLFCTILVSCTLWQIPFSSQRTSSCLVSGTKPLSHVLASKSMTCGTSLEVQ